VAVELLVGVARRATRPGVARRSRPARAAGSSTSDGALPLLRATPSFCGFLAAITVRPLGGG
jgi:hypothetical protein